MNTMRNRITSNVCNACCWGMGLVLLLSVVACTRYRIITPKDIVMVTAGASLGVYLNRVDCGSPGELACSIRDDAESAVLLGLLSFAISKMIEWYEPPEPPDYTTYSVPTYNPAPTHSLTPDQNVKTEPDSDSSSEEEKCPAGQQFDTCSRRCYKPKPCPAGEFCASTAC